MRRGDINRLRRTLDRMDPAPVGCAVCSGPPRLIEVFDGEADPAVPACLTPDVCPPGGVRLVTIRHVGTPRDAAGT